MKAEAINMHNPIYLLTLTTSTMRSDVKEAFSDYWLTLSELVPRAITAIIVLLIFYVTGRFIFRVLGKRVQKRWQNSIVSNFISEAMKYAFYVLGIIFALHILGFGGIASSLIAGAGVSAIIFGFAFKDIGENFLAGFILAFNRPFELGDIIEVDGFKGTVKDLDLRVTHIRNAEGKDIYVPNSVIMKNSLINYTKDGNLRINFMVGIAPESDLEACRKLIIDHLSSQERILKSPVPNVIVQELGEFTVDLNVLFWVDLFKERRSADVELGHTVRSHTISEVKRILDEHGIEMPSQVIEHKMYRNNVLVTKAVAESE